MNDYQKKMLKSIATTVLGLFFIFYVSYNVYLMAFEKVETVTATEKTVNNSITTKGFFIREEKYINNSATGTVIPVAKDGKKVSQGNTVAVAFSNDEDAATYTRIQTLNSELESYLKLDALSPSAAVDTKGLDSSIDDAISGLVDTIATGELDELGDEFVSMRDSITKKQIMLGADYDFQGIIEGLHSELDMLTAKNIKTNVIKADGSGYYISKVDGYENVIDYKAVESIKPEQVESLFNVQPAAVPNNVMGKLVTSFNWYIVTKLDIKDISNLQPGSFVTVDFPYSSTSALKARVVSINVSGANTAAVVLSCNIMDEELANMRSEDIEIIFSSVTGYRVPTKAVREVDGVKGVYILRSNYITFRKINILWSSEEYVVTGDVKDSNDVVIQDDEIKLYDEIIVKGKDLYDGKAIS